MYVEILSHELDIRRRADKDGDRNGRRLYTADCRL